MKYNKLMNGHDKINKIHIDDLQECHPLRIQRTTSNDAGGEGAWRGVGALGIGGDT